MSRRPLYPRSPLPPTPDRAVGDFSIAHEVLQPGTVVPVVSHRTAFLTGRRALDVTLDKPLRVHYLRQGDGPGCLMSDHPSELLDMGTFASAARGRVLIGGLGLGIVARYAARRRSVSSVDVVELRPEIPELLGPLPAKVRVVVADLFAFVRSVPTWPWDVAFFDIWSPTGEAAWVEYVAPLRMAVRDRFGGVRVECWREDEMLGQMGHALVTRSAWPLAASSWAPAHHAFRAATIDRWPPVEGDDMARMIATHERMRDERLIATIRWFLNDIGKPLWNKEFRGHWDSWVDPYGTA